MKLFWIKLKNLLKSSALIILFIIAFLFLGINIYNLKKKKTKIQFYDDDGILYDYYDVLNKIKKINDGKIN